MNKPLYKYLLLSYINEKIAEVRHFLSEFDDLGDDGNPYDGRCGFAVGSNQQIAHEEDATEHWLVMANDLQPFGRIND